MIFTISVYILFNMFWSSVGLRWIAPSRSDLLFAAALGVARTFLWWIFGLVVLYTSLFLQEFEFNTAATRIALYIFLYVPLTWIQWSIIARYIAKRKYAWKEFLFGASAKHFLWRTVGTVISIVLELPNTFLWSLLLQYPFERGGT